MIFLGDTEIGSCVYDVTSETLQKQFLFSPKWIDQEP
jgi:hypothetical protein